MQGHTVQAAESLNEDAGTIYTAHMNSVINDGLQDRQTLHDVTCLSVKTRFEAQTWISGRRHLAC